MEHNFQKKAILIGKQVRKDLFNILRILHIYNKNKETEVLNSFCEINEKST